MYLRSSTPQYSGWIREGEAGQGSLLGDCRQCGWQTGRPQTEQRCRGCRRITSRRATMQVELTGRGYRAWWWRNRRKTRAQHDAQTLGFFPPKCGKEE